MFEFLPYFIQNIKTEINTQHVRAKTKDIRILLRQPGNFGGFAHQETSWLIFFPRKRQNLAFLQQSIDE